MPDDNGFIKDIVKNYHDISKENVLAFNETHLGNTLIELPPTDQLLPYLNPATDTAHKEQFHKRSLSQMIA